MALPRTVEAVPVRCRAATVSAAQATLNFSGSVTDGTLTHFSSRTWTKSSWAPGMKLSNAQTHTREALSVSNFEESDLFSPETRSGLPPLQLGVRSRPAAPTLQNLCCSFAATRSSSSRWNCRSERVSRWIHYLLVGCSVYCCRLGWLVS